MIYVFVACALVWLVFGAYLLRLDMQPRVTRASALLALASALWCATLYKPTAVSTAGWLFTSHSLEALRLFAWWHLVQALSGNRLLHSDSGSGLRQVRMLFAAALAVVLYTGVAPLAGLPALRINLISAALAIASLAPLVAMEQLYRNLNGEQRWAIKFVALALLASTAMDLFCHGHTLLFERIDVQLWLARGPVSLVAGLLLLFGIRRLLRLPAALSLSHQAVFYTGTLMTIAAFLVVVAAGAWYIRNWGGQWSTVFATLFVAAALALLAITLLSGRFRGRLQVWLSRHFLPYRYDHRMEWLRLSERLAEGAENNRVSDAVLKAFARIVDSPAGLLLQPRQQQWHCTESWNLPAPEQAITPDTQELENMQRGWIYNRTDTQTPLPEWLQQQTRAWLAVPLPDQHGLVGICILAEPRSPRRLNWEDYDLLKVAARQAGAVLAQQQASDALAQARQFAAIHQSTAFLVHDIKTLVAQLSLMQRNAEKHKDNPAFIDDMIDTVGHSVSKMERILTQLRQPESDGSRIDTLDALPVLRDIIQRLARISPQPTLTCELSALPVTANASELATVFEHLIRNAQDACQEGGDVSIDAKRDGDAIVIHVRDSGVGMSEEFLRTRLFTPFSSTKGLSGMGIGAYQSRALVEAMGGTLEVESRINRGTCFTIRLRAASQ